MGCGKEGEIAARGGFAAGPAIQPLLTAQQPYLRLAWLSAWPGIALGLALRANVEGEIILALEVRWQGRARALRAQPHAQQWGTLHNLDLQRCESGSQHRGTPPRQCWVASQALNATALNPSEGQIPPSPDLRCRRQMCSRAQTRNQVQGGNTILQSQLMSKSNMNLNQGVTSWISKSNICCAPF